MPVTAKPCRWLIAVLLWIGVAQILSALAIAGEDPPTPARWTFDDSYRSGGALRYTAPDGSIRVELIASEPTELSAAAWLDRYVAKYASALNVTSQTQAANDEAIVTASRAANGADEAVDAAWLEIISQSKAGTTRHQVMAAVVRPGKPVQLATVEVSQQGPQFRELLNQAEVLAAQSDLEPLDWRAALEQEPDASNGADSDNPAEQDARGEVEAALGVDFQELIDRTRAEVDAELESEREAEKEAARKQTRQVNTEASTGTSSSSGKAPPLHSIPGPGVALTGKMLGELPAGYRMNVFATNYWTNRQMTATRQLHLRLNSDGQFEKSSYAIGGGGLGNGNGVVKSRNKEGSTASVFGNTNPGGSGARSVALHKRDGLDPSLYGTYYISGNRIELLHANGQTQAFEFKTDGYSVFFLGNFKYHVDTPPGWERRINKKGNSYRSIDGNLLATVRPIKGKRVTDGMAMARHYLKRRFDSGLITKASPLKHYKSDSDLYRAVTSTIDVNDNGNTYAVDLYIRYGGVYNSKVIWIQRYGGNGDPQAEQTLIRYAR